MARNVTGGAEDSECCSRTTRNLQEQTSMRHYASTALSPFFSLLRPQKFAAEQDKMGGGGRPWLSRHAVCPSRRFNIRFPLTAQKKQNTAEMINVTIIFYLSAMKF